MKETIQKGSAPQTANEVSHDGKHQESPALLLQPSLCKNTHDTQPGHLCPQAGSARFSHTGLQQKQDGSLKGRSAMLSSSLQRAVMKEILLLHRRSLASTRTNYGYPVPSNRFLKRLCFLWLETALIPARIHYMYRRICKSLS